MQYLRSRLGAWWLLLLLGRVMAPEAALLHLHAHHHTVETVLQPAANQSRTTPAQVSPRHRHCHAEQLYHVPFQAALPPRVPRPRHRLRHLAHWAVADVRPAHHLLPGAALRGPPAA